MQVQKEEIRDKILAAATNEFLHKGYSSASLRDIATAAGITPGNIYRYYKNKYALYEVVTKPAWDGIYDLFEHNPWNGQYIANQGLKDLAKKIVKVFLANQKQFIILIKESAEVPGNNARKIIIKLIESHIYDNLNKEIPEKEIDKVLINILAVAITEAMVCIFINFDNNEKLLYQRIYKITSHMLNNCKETFTEGEASC